MQNSECSENSVPLAYSAVVKPLATKAGCLCAFVPSRAAGFTLIELIVAVALLGLVSGIMIHYLVSASRLYALLLAQKQADSEVMDAANRMRREARLHVQTITANSSEWAFSNTYETINFRRSGTDVELNSNCLARGVERFDLKYFNATNSPATNFTQIRRVALDIKATNALADSELKVNFFLRDDLLK